jgi:hypothetical protein
MSILRVGSGAAALLLLGAAVALAQTPGQVCGTVTDPSGTVMPGVSLTLTLKGGDQTTPETTGTNAAGDYVFSDVPVGTYTLSFEFPGFKKAVRPGLVVTASPALRTDQRMEPGSVVEEPVAIAVPSVAYDRPRTGSTFTAEILEAKRPATQPVPPRPCGSPR